MDICRANRILCYLYKLNSTTSKPFTPKGKTINKSKKSVSLKAFNN